MTLKGLHGRNAVHFTNMDYEIARRAGIELMVMMSFTDTNAFNGMRGVRPDMDFIVRLYDDRFNTDGHPTPEEFVDRVSPDIDRLKGYTAKFQIHNEPNHYARIEGWGSTNEDARSFAEWYDKTLQSLRARFPWAQFGFPGLALNWPHRDKPWLSICAEQVKASDWLGCHCYWQYDNMWDDNWGMRHMYYNRRFPNKVIHITEFGDSTPGLRDDVMANEYASYYQTLKNLEYLGSASSFIATSPDPQWAPFCWGWENGIIRPVVDVVWQA